MKISQGVGFEAKITTLQVKKPKKAGLADQMLHYGDGQPIKLNI